MQCFQQGKDEPAPRVVPHKDDAVGLGRPLCCARCGHPITTSAARIDIDGSHEHERTNPHGFAHRFGCFSEAPGCNSVTTPTLEDTWFPGHTWEIGRCERCREHLGWRFAAADRAFWVLIIDRLIEGE